MHATTSAWRKQLRAGSLGSSRRRQADHGGGRGTKKCSKGQNGKHRAAKLRRLKNIKKQKALATQALHAFDDYCALATQRKAAEEEEDEHRGSLNDAVSRPRRTRQDRRQQTQSSVRGEPVVGNSDVEELARHLLVEFCAGKLGALRDGAAVRVRGGRGSGQELSHQTSRRRGAA